ncbi:Lrp/AsnC family transcriptional regulator [Pedobacter frigoris]|uniref:Lrp/AsnC family transcriptional regulator n=1 Tax=Pedobacter frigoris TaxID=2571272 RepID=A0A4U1CP36_9SPHI|nr:Lrp/AsnC family transcriptional regulator [Pedobacter frigoris]TKC07215.1 Lrp/AsnC family transcriptional regulator [Pedobacter frigoris]
MIKEIDEIDLNILTHMQADAKIKMKDLSKKVHLSISAVSKRISRLEELNVIKHYAAILNNELLGLGFTSNVCVRLVSNTSAHVAKFKEEIREFSEIVSCYVVNGKYDFILKVRVKNSTEYNLFYNNCLGTIAGIANLCSFVIVEEVKSDIG